MKIFCPYATGALNIKHNSACLCFKSKNKKSIDSIDGIDSLLNNKEMNRVRLDLVKGQWPLDNCISCKQVEDVNGKSARLKLISNLSENVKEWLINNIDKNGNVKNILNLELRFRNSCNLACRHCDPEYSSQWNSVVKKLGNQKYYDTDVDDISLSKKIPISQWVDFIKDQINADVFKENSNLLFYLEFTGGEPFFQNELYNFLTILNQFPEYKKRIELVITTNGMIANQYRNYNLEELLSGFGKLWLTLSLDASKNFYEYFRQNGNWQQATTGVIAISKNIPNTQISFSISPTVFQCLRFKDIYIDLSNLLGHPLKEKNIIISDITGPRYLRVDNIHKELKKVLISSINKLKININNPGFNKMVDLSLKQLAQPGDINEWIAFCDMTSRLDKIHNKNVFDYFPELKEYWIS